MLTVKPASRERLTLTRTHGCGHRFPYRITRAVTTKFGPLWTDPKQLYRLTASFHIYVTKQHPLSSQKRRWRAWGGLLSHHRTPGFVLHKIPSHPRPLFPETPSCCPGSPWSLAICRRRSAELKAAKLHNALRFLFESERCSSVRLIENARAIVPISTEGHRKHSQMRDAIDIMETWRD
ncbi:unnamed protein product, partial [Iphiclides podalirius]